MKIIKKLNDFIKESVDASDKIFADIVENLEQEYVLEDVSTGKGLEDYLYFVVIDEHPFTISYSDNKTTMTVIVELEEGGTDSLGCFDIDDNIVETITHVIVSYCEQTIED